MGYFSSNSWDGIDGIPIDSGAQSASTRQLVWTGLDDLETSGGGLYLVGSCHMLPSGKLRVCY